jgi:hypothetical protein
MKKLQPLLPEFDGKSGCAGNVAFGPAQIGHQPLLHWIASSYEHDWNGRRCGLRRQTRRCTGCDDDIDLMTNEIGRQRRQAVVLSLGGTVLKRHVAPFNKAAVISKSFRRPAHQAGIQTCSLNSRP